jgi:hypothetical protein
MFSLNDVAFLGSLQPPSTLLLDLYPNAAAAYSLRQLRTGVTSVVRVRRSSDNTEADFTAAQVSDGSLAAWVGAGNNGFVRTWYDQSGNGIDAGNSASGTTQPRVVTSGSLVIDSNTGKPAVLFTAAASTVLNFNRQQNIEQLFTVARNNDSNEGALCRDSAATDLRGLFLRLSPDMWNMQQIGPFPLTGQNLLLQNQTYSLGVLANGTNAIYYTNGASSNTFAEADKISASQLGFYHVGGYLLTGTISEYILYPVDQSASRAAIESNINTHYAIY